MTISDFTILIKKILVGILVFLIPAVIIISGLLFIVSFLGQGTPVSESTVPFK